MSDISYYYLNKLLDIIYLIHYKYNIEFNDNLCKFESDAGNQAEIRGTFNYSLKDRIEIHKVYLSKLYKQRNKIGTKQLKLW